MAISCGDDFVKQSLITYSRVLAIKAEPPEVAPSGTIEVSAFTAEISPIVKYQWTGCPLTKGPYEGFACVAPELEIPLGDQKELTLQIPSEEFIQALINMLPESLFSLEEGVDYYLRLVTTDQHGKGMESFKRIRISKKEKKNMNPQLLGVIANGVTWMEGQAISMREGDEVNLIPVANALSFEEGEEPFFSWFADGGWFESTRTSPEFPENLFRIGKKDGEEKESITLYLVLNDGEGGVDFLTRSIKVVF